MTVVDETTRTDSPAPRRAAPPPSRAPLVRRILLGVLLGVLLAVLLRAFVVQVSVVPTASMENTIQPGDRVLVTKLSAVQRGDVVVFQDPGGWLQRDPIGEPVGTDRLLGLIGIPGAGSAGDVVKRVVGMPGDVVVCCDGSGRVTVNGQPLDETGYLFGDATNGQVRPSEVKFSVTVPAGELFVLGDQRAISKDSRCHLSDQLGTGTRGAPGFVPEDLVVGRVDAVLMPLDRLGRLSRPATFDDVPAATAPAQAEPVVSPVGVVC